MRQHRRFSLTPNLYDFFPRVLSGSPTPEMEPPRRGCSASAALQRLEEPCDRAGDSEAWGFAITVNGGDTIGMVVAVDLERGAPV